MAKKHHFFNNKLFLALLFGGLLFAGPLQDLTENLWIVESETRTLKSELSEETEFEGYKNVKLHETFVYLEYVDCIHFDCHYVPSSGTASRPMTTGPPLRSHHSPLT